MGKTILTCRLSRAMGLLPPDKEGGVGLTEGRLVWYAGNTKLEIRSTKFETILNDINTKFKKVLNI